MSGKSESSFYKSLKENPNILTGKRTIHETGVLNQIAQELHPKNQNSLGQKRKNDDVTKEEEDEENEKLASSKINEEKKKKKKKDEDEDYIPSDSGESDDYDFSDNESFNENQTVFSKYGSEMLNKIKIRMDLDYLKKNLKDVDKIVRDSIDPDSSKQWFKITNDNENFVKRFYLNKEVLEFKESNINQDDSFDYYDYEEITKRTGKTSLQIRRKGFEACLDCISELNSSIEQMFKVVSVKTLENISDFITNSYPNKKYVDIKNVVMERGGQTIHDNIHRLPAAVLYASSSSPEVEQLFNSIPNNVMLRLSLRQPSEYGGYQQLQLFTPPKVTLNPDHCKTFRSTITNICQKLTSNYNTSKYPNLHFEDLSRWYNDNFTIPLLSETVNNFKSKYGDTEWRQHAVELYNIRLVKTPVIIIIEYFESWDTDILSDLISLVSSYRHKIPFILSFLVSTNSDAIYRVLPYQIVQLLDLSPFHLRTQNEIFEHLIKNLFLKDQLFIIGPKTYKFLYDSFKNNHMQVSQTLKELKRIISDHYLGSDLSYFCGKLKSLLDIYDEEELDVMSLEMAQDNQDESCEFTINQFINDEDDDEDDEDKKSSNSNSNSNNNNNCNSNSNGIGGYINIKTENYSQYKHYSPSKSPLKTNTNNNNNNNNNNNIKNNNDNITNNNNNLSNNNNSNILNKSLLYKKIDENNNDSSDISDETSIKELAKEKGKKYDLSDEETRLRLLVERRARGEEVKWASSSSDHCEFDSESDFEINRKDRDALLKFNDEFSFQFSSHNNNKNNNNYQQNNSNNEPVILQLLNIHCRKKVDIKKTIYRNLKQIVSSLKSIKRYNDLVSSNIAREKDIEETYIDVLIFKLARPYILELYHTILSSYLQSSEPIEYSKVIYNIFKEKDHYFGKLQHCITNLPRSKETINSIISSLKQCRKVFKRIKNHNIYYLQFNDFNKKIINYTFIQSKESIALSLINEFKALSNLKDLNISKEDYDASRQQQQQQQQKQKKKKQTRKEALKTFKKVTLFQFLLEQFLGFVKSIKEYYFYNKLKNIPLSEPFNLDSSVKSTAKAFNFNTAEQLKDQLLNSNKYLFCNTCSIDPTHLEDITLVYEIFLGAQRFINLHDWLVAFCAKKSNQSCGKVEITQELKARFQQSVDTLQMFDLIKKTNKRLAHVEKNLF